MLMMVVVLPGRFAVAEGHFFCLNGIFHIVELHPGQSIVESYVQAFRQVNFERVIIYYARNLLEGLSFPKCREIQLR